MSPFQCLEGNMAPRFLENLCTPDINRKQNQPTRENKAFNSRQDTRRITKQITAPALFFLWNWSANLQPPCKASLWFWWTFQWTFQSIGIWVPFDW